MGFFGNLISGIGSALTGNPLGVLGSALGFGSDIYNNAKQNSQYKKQMQLQIQENQKNRDFNRQMAEMSNKWSLDQWNRENQYNLPANQIARLKQAGLNPDLAYSGGVGSVSSSSPNVTSASASGGFSPMSPPASSLEQFNSARLASAQAEDLEASAILKRSQAKGQDITNNHLDDQLSSIIAELDSRHDLNVAQKEEVTQMSQQIIETYKNLRVQNAILRYDALMKKIDTEFYRSFRSAELRKLRAEAGISEKQEQTFMQEFKTRIANLRASTDKLTADAIYQELQTVILSPDAMAALDGADFMKWMSYAKKAGDVLGSFLDSILKVRGKK